MTFFLVWAVWATAVDARGAFKAIAGLAIGLTITIDVFVGGPVTGAAMNPARAFGPELASNTLDRLVDLLDRPRRRSPRRSARLRVPLSPPAEAAGRRHAGVRRRRAAARRDRRLLGQKLHVALDGLALARSRLARGAAEVEQPEEAFARGIPTASRPAFVRRTCGVRQYVAMSRSVAARSTSMIAAAVAHTSSSSIARSPVSAAVASTSVGARSSFWASFPPAARFSASSVSGPRTRKRHGWLRWCVGA